MIIEIDTQSILYVWLELYCYESRLTIKMRSKQWFNHTVVSQTLELICKVISIESKARITLLKYWRHLRKPKYNVKHYF